MPIASLASGFAFPFDLTTGSATEGKKADEARKSSVGCCIRK